MAAIMEIRIEGEVKGVSCAVAHFSIDGKEYLITGTKSFVSVYAGRWINDRRGLGKTFWNVAEISKHYKKNADILTEYANRVMNMAS